MDKASATLKRLQDEQVEDFMVISGNDNLTLPMISLGAEGVISVVANVDPARMSQMVNAALEGDYAKSAKLHYELYDLMKYCSLSQTLFLQRILST